MHGPVPGITFTTGDSATIPGPHGDSVWARAHGRGTNTGPFFVPSSGRDVDFVVIDVARVLDGRIVERWGCWTASPHWPTPVPGTG